MRAIEEICKKCIKLEEFFVVVDRARWYAYYIHLSKLFSDAYILLPQEALGTHLAHARFLRAVYINYPLAGNASADATVTANDIRE